MSAPLLPNLHNTSRSLDERGRVEVISGTAVIGS